MLSFVIVKVVFPEVKAKVEAEGEVTTVNPLMVSLTSKVPLICVGVFISKNFKAVVSAKTFESKASS